MISIERVSNRDKLNKLMKALEETDNEQYREGTIIFVNENRTADFLAAFINETICPATSVHGSRYDWQNTDSLQQYQSRDKPILIATSVDKNVQCSHVINYDIPKREQEYARRFGRTDQTGNKPDVLIFFDVGDTIEASFGTIKEVFDRILKITQ